MRIPGESRQVFDFILRKTWGFQKKSDHISLSQFVAATRIPKSNVCRALRRLVSMGMIVVKNDNDVAVKYSIVKDFTKWKPLSKTTTLSDMTTNVVKNDNLPLSNMSTTIDTKQKTITKDNVLANASTTPVVKNDNGLVENQKSLESRYLTWFGELYAARFGSGYTCSFAKDTVLVKQMLKSLGPDELAKRTQRFFQDDDEFLSRCGHTIGTLRSRINSYNDISWAKRSLGGFNANEAIKIHNWATGSQKGQQIAEQ